MTIKRVLDIDPLTGSVELFHYDETDDTADLTAEYPVQDPSPDPSPETNGPPRVHRKRGGSYPAGENNEPPRPQDQEPPEERPRDRERRATSADDPIPELPADLFDWPEPRREPRSRRRPENPDEDPPESHNGV